MFISYIFLSLIIFFLVIVWSQTANKYHPQKMTRKEYRNLCKALRTKNDKLLDKIVTRIIEKHFLWSLDKNKLKYYFQDTWEKCTHSDKSNFCIHLPTKNDVQNSDVVASFLMLFVLFV